MTSVTDLVTLRKTFTSAYVLDRGKLSRILTIVEDRMSELGGLGETTFTLKLQSGREVQLRSVQEVLALDNSVKNPIRELQSEARSGDQSARVSLGFDSDRTSNVRIIVSALNQRWATELFAELEEQIERALAANWMHLLRKGGAEYVTYMLMGILGLVVLLISLAQRPTAVVLDSGDVALLQRAGSARTTEEKTQIVFEKAVRDLRREVPKPPPAPELPRWRSWITWRMLFLALPILIMIGTVTYLILMCYPWAVFAWGDFEQHYADIVGRRKSLWMVVVMSLLLGLITNLFVASLPALH